MCARYNLRMTPEKLAEVFALLRTAYYQPRLNIKISHRVPVIRASDEGRQASIMRWGLFPAWFKEPKAGKTGELFNARGETVHEKPSFRSAFKSRRCLVPATGFYEWRTEGKVKTPFQVHPPGFAPVAFAGLWERWEPKGGGGEGVDTFTIVTTTAAEPLKAIPHDRSPVMLHPNDYDRWLDPKVTSRADLDDLIQPWDGPLVVEQDTALLTKTMDDQG
jgi:putative SOS response-associated peptidase YedK